MTNDQIALYSYIDLKCSQRLHAWSNGMFAIGNGPIRYIDREEAKRLLRINRYADANKKAPQ